jgi:nucleoside-diphosphate-sugar epimerase
VQIRTQNELSVLVMGGSRFMGLTVVEQLLAKGHAVTTFNRGTREASFSKPIKRLSGDRNDPEALKQLRAEPYDAIVDLSAYTTSQTQGLLDVCGDVQRLIHFSSGAVYFPSLEMPWKEDGELGPWKLWGAYGQEKLASEILLQERRPTDCSTVAIRPPYVLGPRNYAPREEFVFNRLLDDEEILIPGDGNAVVQFVTATQAAEIAVSAMEQFEDGGFRAFNCADPGFVSLRGFVELAGQIVDRTPKIRSVGGGVTGSGATTMDVMNCVFPFPNASYVLDTRALERAGIAPEPVAVRTMLEQALEALLGDPARRKWQRTEAELKILNA